MNQKTKTGSKKEFDQQINNLIKKGSWDKVEDLLLSIESMKISPNKLKKGWADLAYEQMHQDNLVAVIVSLASARKHALDDNKIFAQLLDSLIVFIDKNEKKFSIEDYVRLEYGLNRIYSFQKTRTKTDDININKAKELLTRIRYKKEEAPSKKKSSVTPEVTRIFSALYPDMTHEEVKVEFARIAAPFIRKKLTEAENKNKKKPSSTGGKKPPKDDNDTKLNNDNNKKKPPKK